MIYLLALVFPPLGLLVAGRPFNALVSVGLFALAIVMLVVFFPAVAVIWFVAVVHGLAVVADARADKRTNRIIAAMWRTSSGRAVDRAVQGLDRMSRG